jgi:HlyD family secretion protein
VAEIAVKEYLEGSFPQDQQTIKGEIKLAESELARAGDRLAWSEKQMKEKRVSEAQLLADRMARQKSEIGLQNARTKLAVLQKYTKVKQIAELEANVKKCESDERAKGQARLVADEALADAERKLAVDAMNATEGRAIVALDESITLFDEGKPDAARARLDAAKMLWHEGEEARAKARYRAVKDRIRAEADKLRGGK